MDWSETDRTTIRSLALAAAAQAADALAELVRFTREGPDASRPFGETEVVNQLLDAAKMAMEVEGNESEETNQVYGAIVRFLEGWA